MNTSSSATGATRSRGRWFSLAILLRLSQGVATNVDVEKQSNIRRRVQTEAYSFDCGCDNTCTNEILNRYAGDFRCGDRIDYSMSSWGGSLSEHDACHKVGNYEFPDVCGPECDPSRCNLVPTEPPTPPPSPEIKGYAFSCGCSDSCTNEILNKYAGDFRCGDRIEYSMSSWGGSLSEHDACYKVSNYQFPDVCGPECDPSRCYPVLTEPPSPEPTALHCGCEDCTEEVWESYAGAYTCGSRIEWLQTPDGGSYNEIEACTKIAKDEFPFICGSSCDPTRCGQTHAPSYSPGPPTSGKIGLFCFPDDASRVKYFNVWSKYIIEVKEGDVCGPGNNRFTSGSVAVQDDTLTLSFKKVGNNWEASEVRVLLPDEEMPYSHGTFSFHVKSVMVTDLNSTAVSTVLPKDLVLGLFTWDIQDRYEVNQNWNHEVDFEMSQWGNSGSADMQFLVQPAGQPQKHRFYSGIDGSTYDQSGHTHSFTWLPGHLYWSSTAGGGQTHEYTTEFAITNSLTDLVQCLPSAIDVRINLWNTNGNSAPSGLTDTQKVEVEIGDFTFSPSPEQYVVPSGYCSKHCQCEAAFGCVNGQCVSP